MTDLRELLTQQRILNAVIIDDVYDDAPRPDELPEENWSVFFDDLQEADQKVLTELYPAYDAEKREDLQSSQEFVALVWKSRDKLSNPVRKTLFGEYESTNATERGRLDALVEALKQLGLTCTTIGREFSEAAKAADLVFVDLFLGFQQNEHDIDRAIGRVEELVKDRVQTPPLVVLMSRSPRLWEKRNEFRDRAGLLGSTFRVVSKNDLGQEGVLETILARLVSHYEDAKRVAAFVHAWNSGLETARKRFIQTLRRLDLSDLAQIRALLLNFEGQDLGEYLLDVADRVLQHEIEADIGTIGAAQELNKIQLGKYPAPHLAGSPDLQDLVHRMIFQHMERLRLSSEAESLSLRFGDVLRCKENGTDTLTSRVLLVVTPSCDLMRGGTENVLVLPGDLLALSAGDWSYRSTLTKTPIIKSADGSRFWIKWNVKGRETVPVAVTCELLRDGKGYERVGRLRDIYAIELQQRLLADMGRIGQVANPPATFPVSISLYRVSPEASARSVELAALANAVCFVGRDEDSKRVDHLVLSENACDALRRAIQGISPGEVYPAAQASLAAMKADVDFFERFDRGLVEIPLRNGAWNPEKGLENQVYLHLVRNEGIEEGDSVKGNHRNAPFIMKICDDPSSQEQ